MPLVRPLERDDIEPVCQLMHSRMNDAIGPSRWRRLFDYAWCEDKPDLGFVVVDGGEIAGFMGTIYHRRSIQGRQETFCNLSSWYVASHLRGKGVGQRLLDRFLENTQRYHHSVLSAARHTAIIFARRGFNQLDVHRYIFDPAQAPPCPEMRDLEVLEDRQAILAELPAGEAAILRDHLPYECRHLLLRQGLQSCYLLLKDFHRKRGGWRTEILYSSSYPFIVEHGPLVAKAAAKDERALVTIDARFLERAPAASSHGSLPTPRYYFSERVPRWAYAGLYSEAILLDYEI